MSYNIWQARVCLNAQIFGSSFDSVLTPAAYCETILVYLAYCVFFKDIIDWFDFILFGEKQLISSRAQRLQMKGRYPGHTVEG